MAEIAASILAPVVESTLKSVGAIIKRQFIYLFCFASNIASLKEEANQLDNAIQGVRDKVNHEVTNNARTIHQEAKYWLETSDKLISEKNKIINDVLNVKDGCLKWGSRFHVSKRAKETTEAMATHRLKSDSVTISQQPPAAATKEIPLAKTFSFNSRKEIEQDIMNALKDKRENMIAIHGMGGLGKTTMAIRIMNALLNEKEFDEIVKVVVSENVDEKKIQFDIAGSLGLKDLTNESVLQERIQKIHDRLSASTTRTLLLLDDVWEELNLENLGIPHGSKGCKILITSRNSDALRQMGVQMFFEIDKLTEEEAWHMFREKAGRTCMDDKNLRSIAEEVAKECSGLPIALEVLGASLLNEKSMRVWNDTLNMLKNPNPENTALHIAKAYKPVKISYEKLDEKVKSIFLLCCLFREDTDISLEQMTYFCMGLGLLKYLGNLEHAKDKMYFILKMLKDRSLLLYGRDENHVRIHDVVRDVCIFIAKEEGYIGGKDCRWISHYIQQPTGILESSRELVFPKLRLLMSNGDEFNNDIFLEGMSELFVLYIENYSWKSLPFTQSLNKIRTLVLYHCPQLETISSVGELLHLEILICRSCPNIQELPHEITGLKHLKLLEHTECEFVPRLGRGIISSLVELEELNMLNSFNGWDAIGLSELLELTKLKCLKIQIADPLLAAQKINLSSQLERFEIRFGKHHMSFQEISMKNIVLQWDEGSCIEYWIMKLLKDVESLYLTGKWINKLDFPNYFPKIRFLVLEEFGIKSIETTSMENDDGVATMFPHLDYLKLHDLPHLEDFCKGPISSISFQNLKEIIMYRLPALKQLWKCNSIMSLPQLEDLKISNCEMMEQLFVWSEEDENTTSAGSSIHDVSKSQGVTFPLLQHISITGCPKMRSLVPASLNGYGDHSSHLFCQPQKVTFGSLESLNIEWNPFCHHENICSSFFNGLRNLCISEYDGSMSIFVLSVARNLCNLKKLQILDCNEIVTVIENEKEEGEIVSGGERNRPFPKLEELELFNLGKLETFSNLKNDADLPLLRRVSISRCPNMSNLSLATQNLEISMTHQINFFKVLLSKNENVSLVDGLQELSIVKYNGSASIFSSSIAERLVNLTKLKISDCYNMVKVIEGGERSSTHLFPKLQKLVLQNLYQLEIFWENDVENLKVINCPNTTKFTLSSISSDSFQNLTHLELFHLPALKQLWKTNTIFSLPQLVDINIIGCTMMEQLFGWTEKDGNIAKGSSNHDTEIQGVTFPLLQRIFFIHCPKMRNIVSTSSNGYGDRSSHLFCQAQKVSFGSLKSLSTQWNPFCNHNNICASFLNQLEYFSISKDDGSKSVFVLSVARNLCNLKKLQILDCNEMVTVIEDDKEDGEAVSGGERNCPFPKLEELELYGLGKLETFSSLKNDVDLPSLKKVSISKSPNMSNLSLVTQTLEISRTEHIKLFKVLFSNNENPSFVGVQKLSIKMYRGSTSIFSWPISKTLENLTELRISYCHKMEKVIEGGDRSSTLLFPKLRKLVLSSLSKLEIFCENDVEFPLLEVLGINDCPNITKFTLGSVTSPCLKTFEINWRVYGKDASRDLNSALASANEKEKMKMAMDEEHEGEDEQ